ncbi:MAG: DUF4982 domain-containing protein [bacterium]|nr:DUF4982 domain-containing protein [bacterium]MCM1374671.1 DUF4982 domain-containing protein [Muribaculum sp.]
MEYGVLFNDNWSFLKTEPGTELSAILGRTGEFCPVDVPHDWLIYDTHGLYENSTGWYRKLLTVSPQPGQRTFIRFDGVYMDSTFYVNRQKVGDWKYGYSAFDYDITDYLQQGENELLMQVRHLSPNSRWYSGAGIYRNVWLKICPPVYLPFDGTYVHTLWQQGPDCGKDENSCYRMEIETECAGDVRESVRCHYSLWRETDQVRELGDGELFRRADGQFCFTLKTELTGLEEWDLNHPVCYQLRIELYDAAQADCASSIRPIDSQQVTVGLRRMEFTPDRGFFLNGRHVKIQGVCEHHDLGCLGAAFHKEAMRRKLRILKEMGTNALRTSHNMPALEVMELADEMGILVLSEAFDMWERSKTSYDYSRFFKEWAERDVRSWIRRDRNHPSLFLWSIGNEIYDTHADAHGEEITRRLVAAVRCHDPLGNARITIGSNYMPWEGAQNCADIVKVAGYNYGEKYYALHHHEHPDWIIYGSETASVVQSRGIYRFPLRQSVLAEEDEQCSALGNSSTSWGARSVEACIIDDRDADFSLGQFLWTGFDYIGEPTPYHTKNSYFGYVDTAGFPKDAYYLFQAEWVSAAERPMVHLYPYWDWNPGQLIDVRACSNGDSVELYVNGRSQGRQSLDHVRGKRLQGNWQVPYEQGEITVVAYDGDGREIARESRHSFGEARHLVLEADKEQLAGDGEDLCFVTISAVDENGYPVENAMNYVELTLEGAGRLLGMDNGDSTDYDAYKGSVRKLFNGKLLAVVASRPCSEDDIHEGKTGNRVKISASGWKLEPACLELPVTLAGPRPGISAREDVSRRAAHTAGCGDISAKKCEKLPIPVRKVELLAREGCVMDESRPSITVEARICPADATERSLYWKVVNQNGIPVTFAKVEELDARRARITAIGDGEFYVRCQCGQSPARYISQLELKSQGLGQAFINPYEFVSAGLFSDTIGEITNGNEKGIATSRDGVSGVIYRNLDFGEYGSDEITVPVFALSSDLYELEIWEGEPEEDGTLLLIAPYQKPSQWNVYQEESWKLPRRLKGLTTIAFRLQSRKVHIKGFSFTRLEKAYAKLYGAECSRVYGDSFQVEERAVVGIGNNVTIVYEDMDFGGKGASRVTLWGRSPLPGNTVHIHFTQDGNETTSRVLEVPGTAEYAPQSFVIEALKGRGTVELIFLPGSNYDLEAVQFGV